MNFLYFFIIFAFSLSGHYPFALFAEWRDFHKALKGLSLEEYPILGELYLFWVGQAALHPFLPFLRPIHCYVLYMGIFNVFFEIITAILTMRLVSRYFGQIYASNIMLIFILLPLVWWLTISRWDMPLLAFNVCILYFAVENKPWYAWGSLTIAFLMKFYSIIFGIPLMLYYLERDGLKKTLIYVFSMSILALLIYSPFILIEGWNVFLNGLSFQTTRTFSQTSIWYWIFPLFGNNKKIFEISVYLQAVSLVIYFLWDYFYERNKQNPLGMDKVLIKRFSVAILIFLLTFKRSGFQYGLFAIPLLLIFVNSFKKFVYFIFWIIALHAATYQTIISYVFFYFWIPLTVYFLITVTYFILYTLAIVLIQFNRNLYENNIQILNERDFMLGVYNFGKKIKFWGK